MVKNKISIYLLKNNILNEYDILKEGYRVLHEYNDGKILYYSPTNIYQPKWLHSFFRIDDDGLKNASSQAILLVTLSIEDETKIFAVVFGHGIHMLKDNVVEERFGLITLLNLIGENQIKRINRTNIGGSKKVSDEQVPATTNINEFGFQIDRDLLKKVHAKIDNDFLGKCMVVGGDLLSLSTERDVDNIEELLTYCCQTYQKTDYKTHFDWIDNISPINKDKDLINVLDEQLVTQINERNNEKVMLALPELINWEDISGFRYSGDTSKVEYDDIELETFVDIHTSFENIQQVKNKRINHISANENRAISYWDAYRCLFAEIAYNGKHYCLSDKKWYEISINFIQSVEVGYNSISKSEYTLQDYDHSTESEYNEDIASNMDNAISLDQKNVMFGGSYSRIEICDIFTDDKKLIHIKHNNGSSYMSHLFNQATVSAELLTDSSFRILANQKVHEVSGEYSFEDNLNPRDYTVIIAIIDKYDDEIPRLPFFSKVSIRYAAQRIRAFGYNVEILKIQNIKDH